MNESNEELKELRKDARESANESRQTLDKSVMTVSYTLLGLIIGFFKDISLYLQYSIFLKILFIGIVASFIVTILINLWSHYKSEKLFQDFGFMVDDLINGKNIEDIENREEILKRHSVVQKSNAVYLKIFTTALILLLLFILISIFCAKIDVKDQDNKATIQFNFYKGNNQ